jgi:hypothetical protein
VRRRRGDGAQPAGRSVQQSGWESAAEQLEFALAEADRQHDTGADLHANFRLNADSKTHSVADAAADAVADAAADAVTNAGADAVTNAGADAVTNSRSDADAHAHTGSNRYAICLFMGSGRRRQSQRRR